MSQLPINNFIISIYTRDNYYSLAYYSFDKEELKFKDKFTDNTLNFENILTYVKQLNPAFCLLNLNSKTELFDKLTETLSELFILNRIDDYDSETAESLMSVETDKFTSIKNDYNHVFNRADSVNNLNNNRKKVKNNNQNMNQLSLESLQNNLITTTVQNRNLRVLLLTNKYYNLEHCKKAIFECDFHQDHLFTENDKRIYLTSKINLFDDFLLRSIGSLLIYINDNKLGINNGNGLSVRCFENIQCENYVMIDQLTLNELQVFSYKDHPSIFKKDVFKKHNTSLFSLFNKCKSNYGTNYLRKLFFQPINCYKKLNNRLDDIEQIINLPKDLTTFYKGRLKKIKPINSLIELMKITALNLKQFLLFTTTIKNLIEIYQKVEQQSIDLHIYYKIKQYYPIEFEHILHDIELVINLEKSNEDKQITINENVNENLDKMKAEFENIDEIILIAEQHERNSKLSEFIGNFQIVFSPIYGFVIQIDTNDLDIKNERTMLLTLNDIQYITTTDKFKYYKTKNLKKYDKNYSELMDEISCKQNLILLDLQAGILEKFKNGFDFLEVIGEFDCLLSFAEIALSYDYVRPEFNFNNTINIMNGRHPLKELFENAFIANDYKSEYPNSIKIITGANNAGKTIYLKQNCLIIYMAYLGSFVPAEYCNIPLFSKILTKIETIDSMSTCLSSFTNDLCRLSNILSKTPINSLVVIDEFGKGTNLEDGLSIFAAYIDYIIKENPKSHYIISTHIHSLPDYLNENEHICYQKMEVKFNNNEIFYTYNIVDGQSGFSFPLELAKKFGFDISILNRADEILELSKNYDLKNIIKKMRIHSPNDLKNVNQILEEFKLCKSVLESNQNDNEINQEENDEMECED